MMKRCYALLVRLYPRHFRAEFGAEMQTVFAQSASETRGFKRVLLLCLREFRDLPGNLFQLYWQVIKQESNPMTTISATDIQATQTTEVRQPGSWGAAVMAGLPHLLMGLLIGVGKLIDPEVQVDTNISAILGISLGVLVMAILLLAWRRNWPLWSASWYIYGAWVTIAVLSLTIDKLNLQDSWRYLNMLFLGWIAVCIIGYFFIFSKSALHGLLSIGFLFPLLSVQMIEFVPNPIEGWFGIGIGLMAAISAGAIVRMGDFRRALGLVLAFNLVVGLTFAYISEYQMRDLPGGLSAHQPQFGNFLEFLVFYSIFGLGIVALPFILQGLWKFGKNKLAS